MVRFILIAPLLLGWLGACTPAPAANASVDIGSAAKEAAGTVDAYAGRLAAERAQRRKPAPRPAAPLAPPPPGAPGAPADDRTPVSERPSTRDSAQAAADVVQTYYALLGEGRYGQARALWRQEAAGAEGSPAAFAASFGRYTQYHGHVGAPGRIEAGAGQRYVTVPVQVSARLKNGTALYERGEAVLHRTGDIDGATPERRRWRLETITLHPAAAETAAQAATARGTRPARATGAAASR